MSKTTQEQAIEILEMFLKAIKDGRVVKKFKLQYSPTSIQSIEIELYEEMEELDTNLI